MFTRSITGLYFVPLACPSLEHAHCLNRAAYGFVETTRENFPSIELVMLKFIEAIG